MTSQTKFAVILSGCGVYDGSEIHEAVTTLLAIDKSGSEYTCFAPNIEQAKTMNHVNGIADTLRGDEDNRNVMIESARIARGNIFDLKDFKAQNFDCIIFPGGMGAISNLSDIAEKGMNCTLQDDVKHAIDESYNNGLVIGAMCIAPMLIACALGNKGVCVTIGNDKKLAQEIDKTGAVHEICNATDVCVDEKLRVVTTPCYMLAKSIKEVAQGTENLVKAMMDLI
ncbi:MAG: isoprenoid biosynthesis glyoxalase ElbB [Alphaproteobacteria bacterium]|nr:isoprenoid biosynthesis glyoxalase ElbB [Alphaproteobacteria bacterium]